MAVYCLFIQRLKRRIFFLFSNSNASITFEPLGSRQSKTNIDNEFCPAIVRLSFHNDARHVLLMSTEKMGIFSIPFLLDFDTQPTVLYRAIIVSMTGWTAGQKRTKVGTSIAGSEIEMAPDFECPEEFGYYPAPNDCTR